MGIGDKIRTGLAISLGYYGDGCSTNGVMVRGSGGASFNMQEDACEFSGDWLWLEKSTPYNH
ncbi:MAG: hypothetical protein JXM69_02155 [Anaerolineae bacterium]|nr:hypothetical protein [Anaerolineae bacterium]